MSQQAMDRWERKFRVSAKADGYAILRDHLRQLELPDSPELLLEGTIHMVQAFGDTQLLEMQQYNAVDSTARYAFTFGCGNTYARVLFEPGFKNIDLADMYEWWYDHYVWVSRTDSGKLSNEELRQLEDDVTDDLRMDFSDAEVDFWFEVSSDNTYLLISVYDVVEEVQEAN